MSGRKLKYYFYEKTGMSYITIPKSVAKMMKWEHKEALIMTIEKIDDNIGIFITNELFSESDE